jgi:hypothetical protein
MTLPCAFGDNAPANPALNASNTTMRLTAFAALALLLLPQTSEVGRTATAQTRAQPPIFVFETDEFWLNLHHFLYVLGRAQAKTDDAAREAVAGAPAEAERGFTALTPEERTAWADAVTAYSTGLSQRDAVRGTPMPEITAALAQADDAATLAGVAIDTAVRDTLERAAPVYRKAWWPAHRSSNQAWRTSIERLVAQHGRTILDFVTSAPTGAQ